MLGFGASYIRDLTVHIVRYPGCRRNYGAEKSEPQGNQIGLEISIDVDHTH